MILKLRKNQASNQKIELKKNSKKNFCQFFFLINSDLVNKNWYWILGLEKNMICKLGGQIRIKDNPKYQIVFI